MDAFDSDVLIYAAAMDHELGRRVRSLFAARSAEPGPSVVGVGSVLLLPELLSKPLRRGDTVEVEQLSKLIARLDLRPVDELTAKFAAALGARHGLRAADATHLATAVVAGADRFITNNRKDFPQTIGEIAVTYPDELAPSAGR